MRESWQDRRKGIPAARDFRRRVTGRRVLEGPSASVRDPRAPGPRRQGHHPGNQMRIEPRRKPRRTGRGINLMQKSKALTIRKSRKISLPGTSPPHLTPPDPRPRTIRSRGNRGRCGCKRSSRPWPKTMGEASSARRRVSGTCRSGPGRRLPLWSASTRTGSRCGLPAVRALPQSGFGWPIGAAGSPLSSFLPAFSAGAAELLGQGGLGQA